MKRSDLNKDYIYLLNDCTPVTIYGLLKLYETHKDTHTVELSNPVKMDRHEGLEEDWVAHVGVHFIWKHKPVELDKYRGDGLTCTQW